MWAGCCRKSHPSNLLPGQNPPNWGKASGVSGQPQFSDEQPGGFSGSTSRNISAAMPLTRSHRSAASIALRAATLYERAGAEQDQRVLAECISLYHPDVHMTSSVNGITVRTHGRSELRRVIVEAMGDNRRYRHLNTEVVVDEGDRAVLRTTLVVLQGDRPLVAVSVEWRIRLRDGLISESHGSESPAEDQPNWAPLGSTYSLGGEIVGRWGDEHVLARLYDGRPLELAAPQEFDDAWEVGDQLMVFFVNEAVVGWYLPDKQRGIDFSDLGVTA
jgi:SnoaL-like domain